MPAYPGSIRSQGIGLLFLDVPGIACTTLFPGLQALQVVGGLNATGRALSKV